MAAQINNDSAAERFPCDPSPGAPRNNRDLMLARIANEGLHVLFIAGDNDTGRLDLEDARIGAVQCSGEIVEEEVAFDPPPEVVMDTFTLLLVHCFGSGVAPGKMKCMRSALNQGTSKNLLGILELFTAKTLLPIALGDS